MKWGRKRHTSGSSEPRSSSLISHVFPSSWFSKFKQKSRDTESKSVTGKRKGASSLASVGSPRCANNATVAAREGRFYGGEVDAFWRLSFGKEGFEEKNRNDNLRSVWYDSDNELEAPPSSCRNFRSNAKSLMGEADIKKFNNLILDARKMPGFRRDMEMLPEFDRIKREEKLKKTNRKERWSKFDRNPNETEEILRTSIENINMEFERWKLIDADLGKHGDSSLTNWRNYDLTTIGEDGAFAEHSSKGNYRISAEKRSTEWEKLKDMKIKEIKSKSEDQRKSVYVSRELQRRAKQNSRVKVSSPRIKALEDMKKAKMKTKRGKEKTMEGRTGLESCAVAKCSYDPQKDFRDSMIEMIMEKQIRRPEQLEELLACYLTLNSDVYHDLIIKVFRQVWFDLNQSCFDKEI